jgi:hypothetical protein
VLSKRISRNFEQETQIHYAAKGTNGDIGGIMNEGVHEMDVGTMVKIIGGFDHSVKPHYIELLEWLLRGEKFGYVYSRPLQGDQ